MTEWQKCLWLSYVNKNLQVGVSFLLLHILMFVSTTFEGFFLDVCACFISELYITKPSLYIRNYNVTNLDPSKASGPDCIPLVVLKNCEPELSYILAEQKVSEGVSFSRLLEGLIGGPCI